MNDTTPPAERIDPGAEQAHRDDLARDVGQLWTAAVDDNAKLPVLDDVREVHPALAAALDRLAAAYQEKQ